jgi:hypothetical protein
MTVLMTALPLAAQQKPAAGVVRFPLEMAVTYNATESKTIGGTNFLLQGGGVQIEGRVTPNFGVVADVDGGHIAAISTTGVGLDLVTATFGPRLTWSPARGRYALYGQALAGDGFGFNSVFPANGGVTSTSYNLAVKAGGGMNLALTPRVAVRLFEADWLRTELPNTGSSVQNNFQIGAGVVLRLR